MGDFKFVLGLQLDGEDGGWRLGVGVGDFGFVLGLQLDGENGGWVWVILDSCWVCEKVPERRGKEIIKKCKKNEYFIE